MSKEAKEGLENTNLAPSFLSQNLFASNPAVVVNQVDPVPQNLEAEVVVEGADQEQVETLVPGEI